MSMSKVAAAINQTHSPSEIYDYIDSLSRDDDLDTKDISEHASLYAGVSISEAFVYNYLSYRSGHTKEVSDLSRHDRTTHKIYRSAEARKAAMARLKARTIKNKKIKAAMQSHALVRDKAGIGVTVHGKWLLLDQCAYTSQMAKRLVAHVEKVADQHLEYMSRERLIGLAIDAFGSIAEYKLANIAKHARRLARRKRNRQE